MSTIIVAFFALLYLGLNFEKLKENNIKKGLIINILFIITITSFYWLPFLETKFFSNYQVYEDGMMATRESTASNGLKVKQLFVTINDGSYVFELGPHIIIMLALSVMVFRKIKPDLKEIYIFSLISGLLTLWMATKYFPWKILPEEISIIQFPWRMMMMSAFFLSIVCAINMETVIKKFNYKDVAVISVISILYITAFSNILLYYNDDITDIKNLELGKLSGREVETVAGNAKSEYLPVNAYKDRFYIATREDEIKVIDGNAIIKDENKNGTNYTARIEISSDVDYAILELPYIYYPGYEVRLDGIIVKPFETKNGFLGIAMYKNDSADLEVNYAGTSIMKLSMVISIFALGTFCFYVYKSYKSLKNEEK